MSDILNARNPRSLRRLSILIETLVEHFANRRFSFVLM